MKHSVENAIIAFCIVVCMALIIAWLLAGCAMSQKASDLQVIWHDGECLLIIDSASASQAREIRQDLLFEDCKVHVEGTGGSDK